MTKKSNKPTKAVVVKKEDSVDSYIKQAIAANAPVETMERLFALHKEVKADKAKEAYVQALAKFQSDCPTIEKKKSVLNKDGAVRYKFAPIDVIIEQIKKPLVENGLSYRWESRQAEGFVTAICIITHQLGHSEKSEFSIPVDKEGFMTGPQKYASALTFAKRYSLTNALGILTGDEDTDATDVKDEKDAKSEKAKIVFLLRRLGVNTKERLAIEEAVKKATSLELEEVNYAEIVSRLEMVVREREQYDKENQS